MRKPEHEKGQPETGNDPRRTNKRLKEAQGSRSLMVHFNQIGFVIMGKLTKVGPKNC